jgi:hypothetical protein
MGYLKSRVLGAALAFGTLASAPASAATIVNFFFSAGGVQASGQLTLSCPPGSGPCDVTDISGTMGGKPITPAPNPPPPIPPATNPPISPDNQVTRPGYDPTQNGFDFFWNNTLVMNLTREQAEQWALHSYDPTQGQSVQTVVVTDYKAGVPEPAAWATMLLGLGALGLILRTRRKLAAAA